MWGDAAQSPYPLAHPFYQGKVELKNGARIEHARDGISTGRDYGTWVQPSGGVIVASDAIFHNNRRAVEFLKCKQSQRSTFTRCTFSIDDAYRGDKDFASHVSLWACTGVQFVACTSRNTQSDRAYDPHASNGIYSLDPNYLYGSGVDSVEFWDLDKQTIEVIPGVVRHIVRGPNDTYDVAGQFMRFEGQKVQPIIRLRGPQTVAIDDPRLPPQLRVYPNPAQDHATIAWRFVHLAGTASLTVYDALGRPLAQTTLATPEGQRLWDTRSLPAGLYTYVLRGANHEVLGQGRIAVAR
ncbi:MAG: hypothetical protein OHK0039_22590 [Bacteroidia bacterium]